MAWIFTHSSQGSRFACFTIVRALICAQVLSAIIVLLLFVQHLMDEGNGDRSLADGGGDTFDIAAANIADREHAGQARFEQMRRPRERPMRRRQILGDRSGPVLMNPSRRARRSRRASACWARRRS